MGTSLEISLYPLTPEYVKPIRRFIDALNTYEGFEVMTNAMSTQLHGDFAAVWEALGKELPRAFGAAHASVAVIKVLSIDVVS